MHILVKLFVPILKLGISIWYINNTHTKTEKNNKATMQMQLVLSHAIVTA